MRALVCSPVNYRINWEDPKKNPWMKEDQQPDPALALVQWAKFRSLLTRLGVHVYNLRPRHSLGDQVFTANGAGLFELKSGIKVFVKANLAPAHREPESFLIAKWLCKRGFFVFNLPSHIIFEGQGDIITTKEAHLYFYGIRNSLDAVEEIARIGNLRKPIIPIRLTDPELYHGDLCARYAAYRDAILFYPGGIDNEGIRSIERLKAKKKEMPKRYLIQEIECNKKFIGRNFPMNGCYVGRVEIFPWNNYYGAFPQDLRSWIEKDGGEVVTLDYSQYGISGAGLHCTVLFLD